MRKSICFIFGMVFVAMMFFAAAGCGGGGGGGSQVAVSNDSIVESALDPESSSQEDDGAGEDDGTDEETSMLGGLCGDRVVDAHRGEQCDDGNRVDDDGCSSSCKIGFAKVFDKSTLSRVYSVKQTNDNYVFLGMVRPGDLLTYHWVEMLDSTGEVLWDNQLECQPSGCIDWGEGFDFSFKSDGGIIAIGYGDQAGNANASGWAAGLDANGTSQWESYFGDTTNWEDLRAIEQVSADEYIMVGSTTTYGNWPYVIYVVKIDSQGNLKWDRTYEYTDSEQPSHDFESQGYDVQMTADGRATVVSVVDEDIFYLLKLDVNGNVRWSSVSEFAEYADYRIMGAAIHETTDSGLIVVGDLVFYDGENNHKSILVFKVSQNGDVEWKLPLTDKYINNGQDTITGTSDGNYVIAGTVRDRTKDRSSGIYVTKISPGGEVLWEKQYIEWKFASANSIQQTTDGGFIVGGSRTDENFKERALIMKLDPEGNCNGCTFE